MPVLVSFSAYGQGELRPRSDKVKAAEYYGYALISLGSTGPFDGAGGFGLEFPSGGVVNYDNPTPCSADDSRDYGYVEGTLDYIASSSQLDETKVFMEGFSQNSMYAAYSSVCFADRVAGLWQVSFLSNQCFFPTCIDFFMLLPTRGISSHLFL